jgi:hypothetical protein
MKTTNWISVNKPADIVLDLDVDFEFADKSVNAVTIRDGKGNAVRILRGDYQALKVVVPEPPPMIDKWILEGTICNTPIREEFFDEQDANDRRRRLQNNCAEYDNLHVTKIKVPDAST